MTRLTGFRYVVLGAGRLGVAGAYDLALRANASEVIVADLQASRSREALARLSHLLKGTKTKLRAVTVDASHRPTLVKALKDAHGVLSALPSELHPLAAQAAVQAKAHYVDAHAPFEAACAILNLGPAAKKVGVSLVPHCGLSPGLSSSLAAVGMALLDFAREVRVYAGAVCETQAGALECASTRVEALLPMAIEPARVLRRGRIEEVDPLAETEELDFTGVGRLEACVTGGATSSCPQSFQDRLLSFEQRTIRYPGHFEKLAAMRAMGFLSDKPVCIDGGRVAPRQLFIALAERAAQEKDVVLLRVIVRGKKQGRPTEIGYDLIERYDPATGFSAVDRTAAFSAAAALALQAQGKVKAGAEPVESCLPHREFLTEARRRGLRITEAIRSSL